MLEETRLDNENSSNMKPDWIQVLLEPETKLIRKKILETGNPLEAENIIEANRLIEDLKDITTQINLLEVYGKFYPTAGFLFHFSQHIILYAHKTFTKIDHLLGHKTSLYKFKGMLNI